MCQQVHQANIVFRQWLQAWGILCTNLAKTDLNLKRLPISIQTLGCNVYSRFVLEIWIQVCMTFSKFGGGLMCDIVKNTAVKYSGFHFETPDGLSSDTMQFTPY